MAVWRRRSALTLALLSALVAAGLSAAPAGAAVTCTYDAGAAKVSVMLSATQDQAQVRRSGSAIGLMAGSTFTACGAATVTNTNQIVVTATGPGLQSLLLTLEGGRFQPGKTHEATGVSEIEFVVNLGAGTDAILVEGGPLADNVRLGTGGANLNGDADADVSATGVDAWFLSGNGGADRMGLQGGLGTGSPYRSSPYPFLESSLDGGAGNDVLTGGPNRETFYGGTGNDTLRGGGGNDLMYGNAGADRLEGGADGDGLYPGTGSDVIIGGGGNDSFGAEGGLDGADDFRGGAGSDSVSYVSRSAAVRVDFDGVADDGLPGEHDNIRSDVENASGGSGADRLIGNSFANMFRGNDGADFLDGRGGNDHLSGGGDPDQVNGGADDDELEGGDGGDVLNGGVDDDQLDDGLGSDIVNGGTGNDLFEQGTGSNGADVISGGAGGLDQVFYSSRSAGVSVSLDNTANDGIGLEADNVKDDVEAVYGTPFGDFLTGNAMTNFFSGGGSSDTIFGFDGSDWLVGDAGNDTLNGGDGVDSLDGGADNDVINAIDSNPDQVDGGTGAGDDCNTDAIDVVTAGSCEL